MVGAIGPLGVRIEPFGEMSVAEARDAFARQVQGLLAGGVDGFILETFSDVAELGAAAAAVRAVSDLPIIAQMTVGTDGKTHYGTDPVVFGPELAAMGVDVIGVNCSVGPHGVLEAVEKLARVVTVPISAQPNAGLPREVGDRKMYMASPEYMASYAAPHGGGRRAASSAAAAARPPTTSGPSSGSSRACPRATSTPSRRPHRRSAVQEPVPLAERSRHRLQAGRGSVHHDGGDRAAQGGGSGPDVRPGRAAQGRRASTRSTFPTGRGRRAGWARCSPR